MEKDQVTFALQAAGLTGPVGRPLILVSAVLERRPQHIVVYRSVRGVMLQQKRYEVGDGPLAVGSIDEIMSIIDAETYTSLMYVKGITAEFEELPG